MMMMICNAIEVQHHCVTVFFVEWHVYISVQDSCMIQQEYTFTGHPLEVAAV